MSNTALLQMATITGNNVSHANRNKRRFYPNLQSKRFWSEEQGKWIKLKVSTSGGF